MEITAVVLQKQDEQTGMSLVDVILDAAGQNGTGMWTSQEAMGQEVPIPTIDTARRVDTDGVFHTQWDT